MFFLSSGDGRGCHGQLTSGGTGRSWSNQNQTSYKETTTRLQIPRTTTYPDPRLLPQRMRLIPTLGRRRQRLASNPSIDAHHLHIIRHQKNESYTSVPIRKTIFSHVHCVLNSTHKKTLFREQGGFLLHIFDKMPLSYTLPYHPRLKQNGEAHFDMLLP